MLLYTVDIRQESPSLSHTEPSRDAERITLENPEAPSDYEICRAVKTAIASPQEVSAKRPTVLFSSRLSEMDAQLAALQNIADSLETDFSNSRMVHISFDVPDCKMSDSQVYADQEK